MVNTVSRRAANVLLTITVVFQLAAIVMPWWIIDVSGNDTEIQGIFYSVRCHRDDCTVKSIHDEYKDLISAKERYELTYQNRLEIIEIDHVYHQRITKAVFVMAVFCTTVLLAMAQLCVTPSNLRSIVSASLMACTVGLMVCVVTNDAVKIAYMVDVRDLDSRRDHTFIDFPYCLVIYVCALVISGLVVAALVANTHLAAPPEKKRSDDFDDKMMSYPPQHVVEDTVPIYNIGSETKLTAEEKGVDNPVFSEKL